MNQPTCPKCEGNHRVVSSIIPGSGHSHYCEDCAEWFTPELPPPAPEPSTEPPLTSESKRVIAALKWAHDQAVEQMAMEFKPVGRMVAELEWAFRFMGGKGAL